MKVGLFAAAANPFATPDWLTALATGAEERGFNSLWLGEHAVLFDEYASSYPYAADGRIPVGGEVGMFEPFTALSFFAAATERIRLGTAICLVPQRNPVYTAKEVAAVDWLSGGRFDFGVGVGWLEEEFRALDVPFERRGARTDEYLELMKTLWVDDVSQFDGEFYTLPACRQYPKPVQSPHPPIHVGGESNAALRRAATHGDGWFGFGRTPDEVPERLETLDGYLADNDRTRDDVQITICSYLRGVSTDDVGRYAEAGVDELVLLLFAPDLDMLGAELDRMAAEFLEPASSL